MPGLTNSQRVLFVTWGAAVGLSLARDLAATRDWPCPGRYVRISMLYVLLGVLSEVAPSLATWLGVGFLVAFTVRQGSQEVAATGTFFGVQVRR